MGCKVFAWKQRKMIRSYKLKCPRVQAINISEVNRLLRGKMSSKWVVVNCPFWKVSGHLASAVGCCVVSPGMPDLQVFQQKPESSFFLEIYQCISITSFFLTQCKPNETHLWAFMISLAIIVHSPQSRWHDFLITQIKLLKILQCLPISPGIKLNLISWPV